MEDSFNNYWFQWSGPATTTFETTHTGYGTLKYKLIFKGKPLLNYASRSVQLLDTNGFKLKEIDINSYSFHPVQDGTLGSYRRRVLLWKRLQTSFWLHR